MPRPKVIVMFGPDGAGKSTHIRRLALFLQQRKSKVISTTISSHHMLAYLLRVLAVEFQHYVWVCDGVRYVKYPHPEIFRARLSKKLWLYIEMISLLLVILLKFYLFRVLGYVVIIERGLITSLADFIFAFGNLFTESLCCKLLLMLIHKQINNNEYVFICLDIDYGELIKRRSSMSAPKSYVELLREVNRRFTDMYSERILTIKTKASDIGEVQTLIRKRCL